MLQGIPEEPHKTFVWDGGKEKLIRLKEKEYKAHRGMAKTTCKSLDDATRRKEYAYYWTFIPWKLISNKYFAS